MEGNTFSYILDQLYLNSPFIFRTILLLWLAGFLIWIQVEYDFIEIVWDFI